MWLFTIVAFVTTSLCLSLTSGASYRGTDDLQTRLDQIHISVRDLSMLLNNLDIQKIDAILSQVQSSDTILKDLNNRLDELHKRTEIWSTHEHFITSWLDQIAAVDRKLDIIIKGQERLNKVETQLNEVHQDINKIDIDKFEHLITTADKNQRKGQATKNTLSNELFSFIDEYTTRGVLSSLNRIENELITKVKDAPSSDCSGFNLNSTVELLEDIAAKVDIIVDKVEIPVPTIEIPKKSSTNGTVVDDYDSFDVPEPSTDGVSERTTSSLEPEINKCQKYFDWFVIQERKAYDPDDPSFYNKHLRLNMTLADYKYSYYTNTAFWWGLEHMQEASACELQLRVELWDFKDNFAWAEYEHFSVSNRESNYSLQVSGYSGNASDSLSSHNNMPFSTFDVNNDQAPECCPCAVTYGSGWWYNKCFEANLNGRYSWDPDDIGYYDGIIWEGWLGNYSLKQAKMMIRSRMRN